MLFRSTGKALARRNSVPVSWRESIRAKSNLCNSVLQLRIYIICAHSKSGEAGKTFSVTPELAAVIRANGKIEQGKAPKLRS